jgi:hypothetical protein
MAVEEPKGGTGDQLGKRVEAERAAWNDRKGKR